ncbi:MAG: malate synthase G, partial [Acidiferrobacterales bacterium]|nr:malate synthase G [Acidiferrobacterales bacterium]
MSEYVDIAGLQVATPLYELVRDEIAPGTGISDESVWKSFATIIKDLTPKNDALLARRVALEKQINEWHLDHKDQPHDADAYKQFLYDIGYLVEEGENFQISTQHVDPEIARVAGPQLVVPVNNARYALNAANARWGSLYDALYGTDVIPEDEGTERGKKFNPHRFARVLAYAHKFLDDAAPLSHDSHANVTRYAVRDGELYAIFDDGSEATPTHPECFTGYREDPDSGKLLAVLLSNHHLHIELQIDPGHYLGKLNAAGISDIIMEAAISTIQDCEDSVAAVDAADKVGVYRNWLGLMKGDLEISFKKGSETVTRRLEEDHHFTAANEGELILPGRSLMLVRNVGHLMTTDAVLTKSGEQVYEGMLDAMITSLCAVHDLKHTSSLGNSRTGSIYIVKPKMHGPDEVTFACELFDRVEDALGLERHTIKIGVMDEERRTTLNLKECIRSAKDRLIFINTGFLDRTGDEIHTSMEMGPVLRKSDMKSAPWLLAYEDWNVDVGIRCGLVGKAQIGKGMWTMPNEMRAMLDSKSVHPRAGASCAWVPSPTAAILHAIHYHRIRVSERQAEISKRDIASLDDLLTIPVVGNPTWSKKEIHEELENNVHSILGYVVRWIDQGVGCSTVPDIKHIGLMEDRATLRISSQHVANWLHHGIVSEQQVMDSLKEMAKVVDEQNSKDPFYQPMAPGFDGVAFLAARDLIFKGREIT